MKANLFTAGLAAGVVLASFGCSTTAPSTSWGKAGVSKVDYGTDIDMCTGLAAQQVTGASTNTAGGINGSNNQAQTGSDRGATTQPGAGGTPPPATQGGTVGSTPAGGVYSGVASADYAQRAATQQRTQEMLAKRAKSDALKSCLTERGYKEFTLTAEQRAHLATLKAGSNEYHLYLYKLGSDPAVVGAN
jgi:hypothetical protein